MRLCVRAGGREHTEGTTLAHLFSLPHSLLIVHCIPYMKSRSLQSTWILLNGKHIPCALSTSAVGGLICTLCDSMKGVALLLGPLAALACL